MKRTKVSINKSLFLTAAGLLILAAAIPARAQSQGDGCSNANQVVSIDRPGIPALFCDSGTLQNFFIPKENAAMSCTAAREGALQYIAATDTWNFCNGSTWTALASGGSVALSGITAATGTNTINNAAHAQEWQWNTLAGATGLKLSSTSTAAASNAQKLFEITLSGANGTATQTTYGAYLTNTHTGTSSTNVGLYVSASGGTNNYAAIFANGRVGIGMTTPSVELDVTGNIEYTGHITDVSDIRLKKDIHPLGERGSMLAKLGKVDAYSFTMKDDEKGQLEFGVMAQELEKIFPELVYTADDEMGTKSVNYIGLIPPLVEAIKELQAQNKVMNEQNQILLLRLETIEKRLNAGSKK